jgi:hypothetical protein
MRGAARGVAPAPMRGAPSGAVGGASLAQLRLSGGGDTYRITINGAVDPNGTATQIDDLLTRRAKNLGQRPILSLGRGAYS